MSQPDVPQDRGFEPVRDPGTFLGHPKGLFLLFVTEMWERFSYYGMRALLMLYLISVIAVHQLHPGVYSNELVVQEVQQGSSGGSDEGPTVSRGLRVVVGEVDVAPVADPTSAGGSVLKLERLRAEPDPDNPGKTLWVPDEGDDGAPIVVAGPEGGKGDRKTRGFSNTELHFRVSNPTSKPVRVVVEVKPDKDKGHSYFTVNDQTGVVSTEVKPDSELTKDDKPLELVVKANTHDSGRDWPTDSAAVLYGWYTGLAYLFPIFGGMIADKFIGTHRSMLVGGILIALGHIILGISGLGSLAQSDMGMAAFVMGLAVIVLGTGHFKPTVSVMVGQLYAPGDPRRDGAFTIFYMGINLGAFICAFVCGTLGEQVGWHWGFASAAVGMILGLLVYMIFRSKYLAGIGEISRPTASRDSLGFFVTSFLLSIGFAALFYAGFFGWLGHLIDLLLQNQTLALAVGVGGLAVILGAVGWFVAINHPDDRGPVITIFLFMLFNAFFWIAFEQAGSSINIFTQQNTDRMLGDFEVPATWFQSANAGFILLLAPVFSGLWTFLGRRRMNPSQPVKIALGLIFLGVGYLFMVIAGRSAADGVTKAGMWFLIVTYFWHTVGELCLSPTGLSYVTKAAPIRFVSLLMGIWFISSFIANLGGGLVAAQVDKISSGEIKLPWHFGGQADFFFLFVVFSIGPGIIILLVTPFLKKLMRHPDD